MSVPRFERIAPVTWLLLQGAAGTLLVALTVWSAGTSSNPAAGWLDH